MVHSKSWEINRHVDIEIEFSGINIKHANN